MAVGMTTVFGFLTLLVVVMYLSARFFDGFGHRWPDPDDRPARSASIPSARVTPEVAVVLAAIESHRRQQG